MSSGPYERAYFDEVYRDYAAQNPPRKLRFYAELAARGARGAEGARILDVGCAFGAFLASLGPAWSRHGLDVSAYAVEEARRRVPGARFAISPAGDVPFEGPFDVVTAFDVLEHVPDLRGVGQALHRRLAPGGALVLVVPVYDGPTGPLIRRLDRDATHVHKESRGFWLEWAEGLGLVPEDWRGVYRYLLPGGLYLHWPTRAFRRWTPAIAVIARKAP